MESREISGAWPRYSWLLALFTILPLAGVAVALESYEFGPPDLSEAFVVLAAWFAVPRAVLALLRRNGLAYWSGEPPPPVFLNFGAAISSLRRLPRTTTPLDRLSGENGCLGGLLAHFVTGLALFSWLYLGSRRLGFALFLAPLSLIIVWLGVSGWQRVAVLFAYGAWILWATG